MTLTTTDAVLKMVTHYVRRNAARKVHVCDVVGYVGEPTMDEQVIDALLALTCVGVVRVSYIDGVPHYQWV